MKRSNVKPNEVDMSVTSTDLLRQAKANSQTAWQQLVTRYSRRIYRWCRRGGLQSTDAADVTQEVLHAVARKLGENQPKVRTGKLVFSEWITGPKRCCQSDLKCVCRGV